jgi:hypothetical protein
LNSYKITIEGEPKKYQLIYLKNKHTYNPYNLWWFISWPWTFPFLSPSPFFYL